MILSLIVGKIDRLLINNSKYTDNLLANTIWPLDEADTTERIRKVTKKKTANLFDSWGNIERLWKQLQLEKALDNLNKGKKE